MRAQAPVVMATPPLPSPRTSAGDDNRASGDHYPDPGSTLPTTLMTCTILFSDFLLSTLLGSRGLSGADDPEGMDDWPRPDDDSGIDSDDQVHAADAEMDCSSDEDGCGQCERNYADWPESSSEEAPITASYYHADRDSPSLLEVELSASDEEDDGSVLELVIPVARRYRRLGRPGRAALPRFGLFWSMICCVTGR